MNHASPTLFANLKIRNCSVRGNCLRSESWRRPRFPRVGYRFACTRVPVSDRGTRNAKRAGCRRKRREPGLMSSRRGARLVGRAVLIHCRGLNTRRTQPVRGP